MVMHKYASALRRVQASKQASIPIRPINAISQPPKPLPSALFVPFHLKLPSVTDTYQDLEPSTQHGLSAVPETGWDSADSDVLADVPLKMERVDSPSLSEGLTHRISQLLTAIVLRLE
ncbi:hypothetical protein PHLCEN_2v4213 [Hermanssonia centrifuga]|uniref:Uncharacterized protein n=1 Tax=Hermanssonia centrifuga TaxID=98765 RepID=A0A2R6PYY6_9APHY|nr:hypothetical protein PHLCEN_2v4213 [Hermanssonia centrifuga]